MSIRITSGISQTTTPSDTSLIPTDTSQAMASKKKSDLEGPVNYSAEKITFSLDGKKTYLEGNVKIKYLNMDLEAGKVVINWETNNMLATGVVDSTDSLGNPIYKGLPIFNEKGNEPIYGTELEYNFKAQRGKITSGKTAMEPGYYRGEDIAKIGKKTLLVKNGYFTSCDSVDHPHYYFKSAEMRVLVRKRAVAKPIIMYIEDVPIFAIPFGVFPMERGRRSGLIIPSFGNSNYGGNYLRHLGFYWAASEYWDATLLTNFYERTGVAYEGELRYKKRYSLSGNVNGRFAPKDVTTGQKRQRWSLNFRHDQTINETTSFNASGSFVSDQTFLQQYSHNLQDRLDQVLQTNATFSKRWPSSKNGLSASVSRTENLQTGNLDYTLPRLSFSHSQTNIIPFDPGKSVKRKWYHDIYYNYSSNFTSTGSKTLQQTSDTTSFFQKQSRTGWQHNIALSFNSKILKYLKYNQNLRIDELWVPKYLDYSFDPGTNQAVADTVHKFRARHTFSTSVGASSTIYGLWEIPLLPVKVIRHKMDPSVSFSFSPNFTDPGFGYVQSFTDTLGRTIRRDRFAGNPFGGTSSSESRSMNISVSNLFQGKVINEKGEEKKIDLFNFNFGSSYNFIADSLKWSDIQSSFRTKASKDFDLTFSMVHSLYKPTSLGSGRRNEYVWENGFGLPRLVNFQLNARLHLAPPEKKEKKESEQPALEDSTLAEEEQEPDIVRDPITEGLKEFKLPWDITTNFTYNYNKSNIRNPTKRFSANVSARIELTENWRIQYSTSLDLIGKKIDYQSFNIYRDLHCWEMSFAWGPNPQGYSFFTFEIRIKESVLKDIKLTKSSGGRRVY
jgi:lipopolysaccharide export system protein LptA